jgi:hypothetical protein
MKVFLALLAGVCLIQTASAALTFDSQASVTDVMEGQKEIHASFAFKNSGSTTVTITEVRTSCGCTTAKLDKKVYAPGEEGSIAATMKITSRGGKQSKTVTVMTDDPKQKSVTLAVTANIPVVMTVTPTFVYWRQGDELSEKTVRIDVKQAEPVSIAKIAASKEGFDFNLRTVQPGRKYVLTVKPRSTDALVRSSLTIVTDYPKDKPNSYNVTASILPNFNKKK